jgi:type IV pilus assembly protein PilW
MTAMRTSRRFRGVTLIEIMISMAIGLVVVGAVIVSFISSGKAGRYQTALSQMNQDAQIGLSMLAREVQLAGYSSPAGLTNNAAAGGTPNFIVSYNVTWGGTNTFIYGCDGTRGTSTFADPTATQLACGASVTPTTSGFGVVYEADLLNTVKIGAAGAEKPSDCLGNGLDPIGTATFAIARNRYYVAPGPSGRPELYCASSFNAGARTPLLENVEDMQVWYGTWVATPRQVGRYAKAGINTTASTVNFQNTATPGEWNRVISVRICLLMRSAEPVFNETVVATGNEDTLTYLDCDSVTQTSSDRYLRRAYFTTATLRSMMAY